MDFGMDGCYSQRAAEIRNKVWKLRGDWSEVTVMVFGFIGYVQRIAMIRKQHFFRKVWLEGKYTNNKNCFLCSYFWRTDIEINFNILYIQCERRVKIINFATCVLFSEVLTFVVKSTTGGGKQYSTFIMATCSLISEEPTSHYNTEINPKPLTFPKKNFYSISPRDTTMIHMSLVTWL